MAFVFGKSGVESFDIKLPNKVQCMTALTAVPSLESFRWVSRRAGSTGG